MGRETNIDSTRVPEEKTREHEAAVIKLKRAQNSLLNISKLPPELLGRIFHCNVTPEDDFDGLDERSHNFLLVCHHWFQVASRTPEIWSFGGNSLKEWARWCRRSGNAPLDLVLVDSDDYDDGDDSDSDSGRPYEAHIGDTFLCDALRNRAAQGTIRRVHLHAPYNYLESVIDLLTADRGEPRPNGIESIIFWNAPDSLDVSSFFAHSRFPKLQRLELDCSTISSWDHLTSQTSVLTILELNFGVPSPTPTTSQLLSVLSSNPALRKVRLFDRAVPDDGGVESPIRVQLHHLKELLLDGGLRHVIRLLDQLDHPGNMDHLCLTLRDSDAIDISQIVGPYVRNHLQRRDRPQNGSNLRVSGGCTEPWECDTPGIRLSASERGQIHATVWVRVVLRGEPHRTLTERAALNLITYVPLEEAVFFLARHIPIIMEDIHTRFPNLRELYFQAVLLRVAFPDPNPVKSGEAFPSLEHLTLERVVVDDGDWSPLLTFLACRVTSGNRLDTLKIFSSTHICPKVMEAIRGLVRVFEFQEVEVEESEVED